MTFSLPVKGIKEMRLVEISVVLLETGDRTFSALFISQKITKNISREDAGVENERAVWKA